MASTPPTCPCGSEDCASSSNPRSTINKTSSIPLQYTEAEHENPPPPSTHVLTYPPNLNISHPALPRLLARAVRSIEVWEEGLGWALNKFLREYGFGMPDLLTSQGMMEGNGKGKERGNEAVVDVRLFWGMNVNYQKCFDRRGDVVWIVYVGLGLGEGLVRDMVVVKEEQGKGEREEEQSQLREEGEKRELGVKRKREEIDDEGDQGRKRVRQEEKEEEYEDEDETDVSEVESVWDHGLDDTEGGGEEEGHPHGNRRSRDSGVGIKINM